MKLTLVHYNPIEYYPPVHNLIAYLDLKFKLEIHTTYTTSLQHLYQYSNAKVLRLAKFNASMKLLIVVNIILFNFNSFCLLILKRPKIVLYYETWSCLPIYFYKILRPKTKLLIHHHEFASYAEIKNSQSFLLKLLTKIEKRLLKNADWISHTNNDRLNKFLNENTVSVNCLKETLPNYPPKKWIQSKQLSFGHPIKMVYLGSLSTEHMYLKEIADWIVEEGGRFTLDIYSVNINRDALAYIKTKNTDLINFVGGVEYENIPKVLQNYNIGLILYNGISLNYIYNAPNKLFEYFACGLDVWFSSDLKSSKEYIKQNSLPKIIEVDFKNLNICDITGMLQRNNLQFEKSEYYAEKIYIKLEKYLNSLEDFNT